MTHKGYKDADKAGHSYSSGGMARHKNEKNYGNCRFDEKATRGQTIRTESSPDKSSYMVPKSESVMATMPDTGTSRSLSPEMYNEKAPAKRSY